MSLDGPIAIATATTDGFTWASLYSERCSQRPKIGALHLQKLLPMASLRPIIYSTSAANASRDWPTVMSQNFTCPAPYAWDLPVHMCYWQLLLANQNHISSHNGHLPSH